MKHAPVGYECPFCRIAGTLAAPSPESAIVFVDSRVFAFVPLHHYGDIRGNCLIAPKRHYENMFDIPADLGADIFRVSRLLAVAMQKCFGCEGVSTRQHNGPTGDQDVWHFHQHLFPRFDGDGLWGGKKEPYDAAERMELADRLRTALH